MKTCLLLLSLLTALPALAETAKQPEAPAFGRDFLSLVMRHLYRWHLDETTLIAAGDEPNVVFHWREIRPALDEGDRSSYVELVIPRIAYSLLLKKAHYDIPELNATITNADYRIVKAERYEKPPEDLETYRQASLERGEIIAYLFSVRNQRTYPDAALRERMREALRSHFAARERPATEAAGPQTVYIAPLSPVSNNLWVFWENQATIIRFSSDSDLASPAFWDIEKLGVDVYDLKQDVVVSMDEAAGSNAYVTRDWAARVLFNCVVFGQRLVMEPEAP